MAVSSGSDSDFNGCCARLPACVPDIMNSRKEQIDNAHARTLPFADREGLLKLFGILTLITVLVELEAHQVKMPLVDCIQRSLTAPLVSDGFGDLHLP